MKKKEGENVYALTIYPPAIIIIVIHFCFVEADTNELKFTVPWVPVGYNCMCCTTFFYLSTAIGYIISNFYYTQHNNHNSICFIVLSSKRFHREEVDLPHSISKGRRQNHGNLTWEMSFSQSWERVSKNHTQQSIPIHT